MLSPLWTIVTHSFRRHADTLGGITQHERGIVLIGQSEGANLLGPMTVSSGGRDIDLGPPRQRALFASLASHANRVVDRDELVDAVWGVDAPTTAVNSIYTYIARLRHALEPSRPHRGPSDLLVSHGSGYMLRLSPERIDIQQFESHLEKARQLSHTNALHSAVGELDSGLALWRGTAYGGAVGPFVDAERNRLTELRLTAMEDRAEMLVELEHYSKVVGELFSLVRRHPLRERLRYLLMLCYTGLGRQADALAEYHDLRGTLAEEFGVEPGEQLQWYYEQILRGRHSHRPTPAPAYEPVETATPPRTVPIAQLARDVPGFTGRAAELRQMHDVVTCAEGAGESAVVLLTGGPGVGKSALAVHFAHALSRRFPDGQLYVDLQGFANVERPMPPSDALGHLIAALDGPATGAGDLERQRAQYRSLAAGRRLLILLDNAICVEQVRPLLPANPSCMVIVTSRHNMTGLSVRDGARRITLDVLREEDALNLVRRVVGRAFGPREYPTIRKLVAACGNLPLALRIAATRIATAPSADGVIADLTGRDVLDRLEVPGDHHSSLRTVFEWSYRHLTPEAAQMFTALGRHTGPDVDLVTAAGLGNIGTFCARRNMDALIDANLAREPARDTFRLNPLVFAYAQHLATEGGRPAGETDGHRLDHV